jgi:hypothetical protein
VSLEAGLRIRKGYVRVSRRQSPCTAGLQPGFSSDWLWIQKGNVETEFTDAGRRAKLGSVALPTVIESQGESEMVTLVRGCQPSGSGLNKRGLIFV